MSIYDPDLAGRTKHGIAIARIRNFCAGRKTLVAFSGGKDSQCCYHLCEEAGIPFSAQYSITRFEPPQLMHFIREHYPDVTFRRAYRHSLVEDIERSGLPSRWARWCCNAKHKATPGFDIAVIGVRAEESSRRAANWREASAPTIRSSAPPRTRVGQGIVFSSAPASKERMACPFTRNRS